MKLLYLSPLLACLLLVACDKSKEKEKLRQELLTHYQTPADSLRRKAALFLVDHIDGLSAGESEQEDLGTIEADYLIRNIDLAFEAASGQLNDGSLPFADFCEYVLPHRLANESLTPWREQCLKEFGTLRDTFRLADDRNIAICKHVNIDFYHGFKYSGTEPQARYLSWEEMSKNKKGDCWLMTSLITYPMRALGMAVTTDFAPMWGNSNGGPHAWNMLMTSNHSWTRFMGCETYPAFPADFQPFGIYHEQRVPAKVFRKTYSINKETLPHLVSDEDDIPYNLLFDRAIDVTELYLPTTDIDIDLAEEPETELVYLATFSNGEWVPVYWAKPDKKHCRFSKMAKGLVYLPCTYRGGKGVTALGKPFYVDEETGKNVICEPDARQKKAVSVAHTRSKASEEIAVYSLGLPVPALFQTMDSVCLDLKRSAPVQNKLYRLYYWDNDAWQLAGEQKKEGDKPLQFANVPAGALYRLVPDDSKNTERFFTYANNRQLWW